MNPSEVPATRGEKDDSLRMRPRADGVRVEWYEDSDHKNLTPKDQGSNPGEAPLQAPVAEADKYTIGLHSTEREKGVLYYYYYNHVFSQERCILVLSDKRKF